MRANSFLRSKPSQWGQLIARGVASWWYMVHLGAIALVMAMSASTYGRASRAAIARQIYVSTWQVLPWFTLLATLLSLVLIRIVVVSALSYGLSQYALEMVVRVLVLELIPLAAALFVALRAGLAFNAGIAKPATNGPDSPAIDVAHLRGQLVPQVIASAFSVMSLAIVNSVIVLLLAYVLVYGLSPWGMVDYTRTVGRVFDPAVTIGFAFKTIFFGLAVAVIPAAAMLEAQRLGRRSASTVQPGAVRLLFVLLLIEAASLVVKYI